MFQGLTYVRNRLLFSMLFKCSAIITLLLLFLKIWIQNQTIQLSFCILFLARKFIQSYREHTICLIEKQRVQFEMHIEKQNREEKGGGQAWQ